MWVKKRRRFIGMILIVLEAHKRCSIYCVYHWTHKESFEEMRFVLLQKLEWLRYFFATSARFCESKQWDGHKGGRCRVWWCGKQRLGRAIVNRKEKLKGKIMNVVEKMLENRIVEKELIFSIIFFDQLQFAIFSKKLIHISVDLFKIKRIRFCKRLKLRVKVGIFKIWGAENLF